MIVGGIDVGARTTKAVILEDNELRAFSILDTGIDMQKASEEALDLALKKASLSKTDLQRIIATGIGRTVVPHVSDTISDVTADAKGGFWLFPEARTFIDVGAEEGRAVRVDSTGKVVDFNKNEKCAAGAGTFAEAMARALETATDEIGLLSLRSTKEVPINATCVVFAESEVVSLIHEGSLKEDIANAIHEAMVTRVVAMVKRMEVEKEVAFFGGVAKNVGVVKKLESQLGVNLLVPREPQIVGAIGAALLAL
jgi:benzoyl-CoA reductase subunit D